MASIGSPGSADSAGRPGSAGRRELTGTLALVLIGGVLILGCAGRTWASVTVPRQPPFSAVRVALSGHRLYPALTGLAVVALIVAVLVLVTGGWARRVLGLLLIVVAVSTGWDAGRGTAAPAANRTLELTSDKLSQRSGVLAVQPHPAWAWCSLAGSALVLLAGLALLVRSGGWQSGLSARYAAPAETPAVADPWRQLDRGEDPTIRDG